MHVSDFEVAMVIAWFAGLLASCVGLVVWFEMRERRSPVGRLTRQRWFGV